MSVNEYHCWKENSLSPVTCDHADIFKTPPLLFLSGSVAPQQEGFEGTDRSDRSICCWDPQTRRAIYLLCDCDENSHPVIVAHPIT